MKNFNLRGLDVSKEDIGKVLTAQGITDYKVSTYVGSKIVEVSFTASGSAGKSIVEMLLQDGFEFDFTTAGDFISPPELLRVRKGKVVKKGYCFNYTGEEDGIVAISELEEAIYRMTDEKEALQKIRELVFERCMMLED